MRSRSTWKKPSFPFLLVFALPLIEGGVVDEDPVREGSIVGGKDIPISEAPHMVSILKRGCLACGGSILDERTILTAAHCLSRVHQPCQISVRTGSSFFNKGGRVYVAESIQTHKKYTVIPLPDYDVGIIRVRDPIRFDENARPIALPEDTPKAGTTVRISGWGQTQEGGAASQHLKSTEVDIYDWGKCRKLYGKITDRMVCASRPGRDSCLGDSGGGMDFNGTVVGVVSFGYHCADPVYPGVYANVANPEILQFIRRNLN